MPPLASTEEISNAVQMEHKRMVKSELVVRKNFLASLFKPKKNSAFKISQDFIGDIKTTNERAADSADTDVTSRVDPYEVEADTPPAYDPDWRRRINNLVSDSISTRVPRPHAKLTAKGLKELANLIVKQVYKAKAKVESQQILELIRFKYHIENPTVLDRPSPTNVGIYPKGSSVLMPTINQIGTGNTATYQAPMTLQHFRVLTGLLADSIRSTVMDDEDVSDSLGGISKIAIFSNAGWIAFIEQNIGIVGHRDFFGKAVQVDGYKGKFMKLDDVLVYVVPTQVMTAGYVNSITGALGGGANRFAALNQPVFPVPFATTRGSGARRNDYEGLFVRGGFPVQNSLSTGAGSLSVSGVTHGQVTAVDPGTGATPTARATSGNDAITSGKHSTVFGLHECIIMYKDAFECYDPYTLDVGMRNYEDFLKDFTPKMYCKWHKEGTRFFDDAVIRCFFTGEGTTITHS